MISRSSHTVSKAILTGGLAPYVATAIVVGAVYVVAYEQGVLHGTLETRRKYRKFMQRMDEVQRIASMN